MESKLPTKMQSQDEQDELDVMEVEDDVDDDIPDLVEIHQAPTNANNQPPAVQLIENQETFRMPVSIPGLDGEAAENGYWPQLPESESESDSDSDSNWVSDSDSDWGPESDDVDDDFPYLVEIHQAHTNANSQRQAVQLAENQETVRMPVSIPGLDGEEENGYWPQLPESESESEYQEQTARESGIEENEDGTIVRRFIILIPEEMARTLNNPVSRPSLSNALLSLFMPFLVAEMGTDGAEPTNGMGPEEKDAIPEIAIDDGPAEFEGQRTCSVCIEDFVVGERARQPICSHLFHQKCLWPWLDFNRTCPSCRHLL